MCLFFFLIWTLMENWEGRFFRRMYSPPSWGIKNSEENAFDGGECMLLNCHKRKTFLMKVFYILIWVSSMVCIQSGHFNSWKALSFLSGRLMPGTSTVICWMDGFAMECTRRLWETFLVSGSGCDFLAVSPSWLAQKFLWRAETSKGTNWAKKSSEVWLGDCKLRSIKNWA